MESPLGTSVVAVWRSSMGPELDVENQLASILRDPGHPSRSDDNVCVRVVKRLRESIGSDEHSWVAATFDYVAIIRLPTGKLNVLREIGEGLGVTIADARNCPDGVRLEMTRLLHVQQSLLATLRGMASESPTDWVTAYGDPVDDAFLTSIASGVMRAEIDPRTLQVLLGELGSRDRFRRIDAAMQLGRGRRVPDVTRALATLLADADDGVASVAALSLASIGATETFEQILGRMLAVDASKSIESALSFAAAVRRLILVMDSPNRAAALAKVAVLAGDGTMHALVAAEILHRSQIS